MDFVPAVRCPLHHVGVPGQAMGCETCGASGSDLQAIQLEAKGTVLDRARNAADDTWVATVMLTDGPAIRAWLETPAAVSGQAVHGKWRGGKLVFESIT